MTPEIKAKLVELAPNVVFATSKELDPSFVWDGDGPDPETEGFSPYDVTFSATTIIGGELIEANAYLGGCYMEFNEEIGDCGGYLLQKLEEAAEELFQDTNNVEVRAQLRNVVNFLKSEMKRRYDEQMTPAIEA